jgi:ABC-2 type transport system ATP-binding protein
VGGARGLVLDGVSKRFGRGHWVLDNVELAVEPESVTFVVGANGCGKSTLLRIGAGLSRPTVGRVLGRPAHVAFAPERLPARLRLSGRQYVTHMGRLRGLHPAQASKRADELFDRLRLSPGPDVPLRSLSKGNTQKVALVQAFLAPVGLLILDEPFSGLDASARDAVGELMTESRSSGAAVLISSHATVSEIRPDRALELLGGRLQPSGAAEEPWMDIELRGGADGTGGFEDLPGVRIQDVDRARRRLTLSVRRSVADATLARALADGWSVVSVTSAPSSGSDNS